MNTSESIIQQMQGFQNNYPSVGYDLLIPEDEPIYEVNQITRKINGPKELGVNEDHQSNKIVFEIDRDCNGYDLATMTCIIIFKNAKNETYSYVVPKYNIIKGQENPEDPDDTTWHKKLYFVWLLQAPVMKKAGIVQYMIKFFNVTPSGEINFEFNTQIAQSRVLETWNSSLTDVSNEYNILMDPQILELFANMQIAIDNQYFDVYWTDL